MDIIIKSRGHGKTRELIQMSSENNIPIVTHNTDYIKYLAQKLNYTIPEPIAYNNLKNYPNLSVYIDELDMFLKAITSCNCEAFTITLDD